MQRFRHAWILSATSLGWACGPADDDPTNTSTESSSQSTSNLSTSDDSTASSDADPPTWYRDIAPLVLGKCLPCHSPGNVAPMALDNYAAAAQWAAASLVAIESGKMPPFAARSSDACQPLLPFRDDISLSSAQIELFRRWINAKTPEGDAATASAVPDPPRVDLDRVDWQGKMPTPVTIEPGKDHFYCIVIDPKLTSQTFFDGIQILPGNAKVVHHVLVYSASDAAIGDKAGDDGIWECSAGGTPGDKLIGAWAPGTPPTVAPVGAVTVLDPGTKLVLNVHYHPRPTGPEIDSETSVALRWHAGVPEYISQVALVGNFDSYDAITHSGLLAGENDAGGVAEFRIPALASHHVEKQIYQATAADLQVKELAIWGVGSHMHYVGTDLKITLDRATPQLAEPAHECLLHTPYWDFEWQRGYVYAADLAQTPKIRVDDRLSIDCIYNNTMDNPKVVKALADQGLSQPIEVRLGEETLDEMCLGVFMVAAKLPGLAPEQIRAVSQGLANFAARSRPTGKANGH